MSQSFLLQIPTGTYDQFITGCQTLSNFAPIKTRFNLDTSQTATLLRAYALRYFPQELLSTPLALDDRKLCEEAIEVVNQANRVESTNTPDLSSFQIAFQIFSNHFKDWLIMDKHRVVLPFIAKLNQLRQLREQIDTERPFYTAELKQLIDLSLLQLIGQINGLGGETALGRIDELLPFTTPDPEFITQFRKDAASAFWATFRERLPSLEGIISLLVDFVHRYMRLVPSRNDLLEQLTEVLDIEFIRQKIATQVVTLEDLRGYLGYILDLTKRVGAPADDDSIEQTYSSLIYADLPVVDLLEGFFTPLFSYYDELMRVTVAERERLRAN